MAAGDVPALTADKGSHLSTMETGSVLMSRGSVTDAIDPSLGGNPIACDDGWGEQNSGGGLSHSPG